MRTGRNSPTDSSLSDTSLPCANSSRITRFGMMLIPTPCVTASLIICRLSNRNTVSTLDPFLAEIAVNILLDGKSSSNPTNA